MQRVDYEDLGDGGRGFEGIVTNLGRLFTGIGQELDGERKRVVAETGFQLGRHHGPSREWFASGHRKEETYYRNGAPHGSSREWNERGVLLREDIWYSGSFLVGRRKWSDEGTLTEDTRGLDGSDVPRWQEYRRKHGREPLVELVNDEFVEVPWPYEHLIPPGVDPLPPL